MDKKCRFWGVFVPPRPYLCPMQNAPTVTLAKTEYERLQAERARLQAENDWLKRQIFGVKSERFVPAQAVAPQQLRLEFDGGQLDADAEQTVGQAVAAYERKKPQPEKRPHPGRVAIPEHLRREDVVLEPAEDTTGMVRIGEDVTETLEYSKPPRNPVHHRQCYAPRVSPGFQFCGNRWWRSPIFVSAMRESTSASQISGFTPACLQAEKKV